MVCDTIFAWMHRRYWKNECTEHCVNTINFIPLFLLSLRRKTSFRLYGTSPHSSSSTTLPFNDAKNRKNFCYVIKMNIVMVFRSYAWYSCMLPLEVHFCCWIYLSNWNKKRTCWKLLRRLHRKVLLFFIPTK